MQQPWFFLEILRLSPVLAALSALASAAVVIALGWAHHPEGLRRKKRKSR